MVSKTDGHKLEITIIVNSENSRNGPNDPSLLFLCCLVIPGTCGRISEIENGSLSGRTLYFLFQGAGPEKWMLEAGEYTMKCFAGLYGMQYAGMATNCSEAAKLSKNI